MYENFYKFDAKPFRLTPDPRFLFNSRSHMRAMAYLRYGLQLGEGFVIITGDIGAGKTTLSRAMLKNLSEDQNIIAAQLVSTQLESDDLLRAAAAAFGLETEGLAKSSLLANLEHFMVSRAESGKRVLLLVDEVQNLPPRSLEELRMLSNFQVGDHALMQCFLLGQEEFHKTIQRSDMDQFRQRVIAAHHLGPMDREETEQYVLHRLRVVGWKNDPTIDKDAFDLIYEYAEGIPRRTNLLCDRVLLYGALEEIHAITGDIVRKVREEQEQELGGALVGSDENENPAPVPSTEIPVLHGDASAADGSLAQRVTALEARVAQLEATIKKEREKNKKMIMMAMLSNDDMELPEVLEITRKVDEA